jgi:hypothetical protein
MYVTYPHSLAVKSAMGNICKKSKYNLVYLPGSFRDDELDSQVDSLLKHFGPNICVLAQYVGMGHWVFVCHTDSDTYEIYCEEPKYLPESVRRIILDPFYFYESKIINKNFDYIYIGILDGGSRRSDVPFKK